jgi:hypothetical protein
MPQCDQSTRARWTMPIKPAAKHLALLGLATIASYTAAQNSALDQTIASDGFPMVGLPIFMEHVVTPTAFAIWDASGYSVDADGTHDLSPQSDEEWENAVSASATLLEIAHLMVMPERVLDDEWTKLVRRLNAAAQQALVAAENHDKDGFAAAGDELNESCMACHVHYGLE